MLRSFAKEEGTTVDLLWQLLDDMMQESYDDISGKPALSQYYSSDGSYEWSPCTILTFDSRRQLFRIRWARTRKQKWVSRLNLRLEEEDLASWIRKTKLIRILERDKSRFETRNKWMAEAMPTLEETKMRDDDAFMERTRSACLAMARNSKVPFPERLASFREPKRRLGQQHPTHPLTHSHNISSHPIPSHPIPFHPIPSHSIPSHSTRHYSGTTSCENCKNSIADRISRRACTTSTTSWAAETSSSFPKSSSRVRGGSGKS